MARRMEVCFEPKVPNAARCMKGSSRKPDRNAFAKYAQFDFRIDKSVSDC